MFEQGNGIIKSELKERKRRRLRMIKTHLIIRQRSVMMKLLNQSFEYENLESKEIRLIKFTFILLMSPVSILLNIILIIYSIKTRQILLSLHHHVILFLLIVCFLTNSIEIPRILHYLRLGFVDPSTRLSCLIWQFCDYLFFAQSNVFMFWASFQRHLLVFNSNLFLIKRYRFYLHYLPMIFFNIYLFLFYFILIFVYQCEQIYDYLSPLCGSPCFNNQSSISLIDLFLHSWIPIILIAFFSLTLIIRVFIRQRIFHRQQIHWRRYRRMIVQLLLISSIYFICLGPYTLIQIIDLIVVLPPSAKHIQTVHLFYLYWFLSLLFPFVSLQCLPEVKEKLKKFLRKRFFQRNFVSPVHFIRQ